MKPTGPGPRTARSQRAPVDRRLWARARGVRALLGVSAGVGLAVTGCLVTQAVFLSDLLARLFHEPVRLGDVTADLVGFGVASAARALALAAGATLGARAANVVRGNLRRDALRALLQRGPVHLAGERTGELAVTVGPGLDALDAYVGDYLPRLVLAGLAPVVLLSVVGALDWVSGLILLVALGVVPVFMVLVGRLTEARVTRRLGALGALGAHFLDAVEGLPTLRAYGRARRQEAQVADVTEDLRRATLAVLRETFLSALVLETLAAVGTALVAVPLALRLIDGHMALAPALTILVLTPEVFLPLRRASADFHAAADGLAATDRVFELLDDGSGVTAPPKKGAGPPGPVHVQVVALGGGERVPGRGSPNGVPCLSVSGLSVTYPGRDRPAVEGCHLVVAPGERVVLVGPSGAGKSTLLAALVALVPLSAGRISLGGLHQDEADPELWRRHFSYLPQRPQLFSGSLLDNLRLGQGGAGDGSPGEPLDDLVVARALHVAQLDALVASMPLGLATPVGEGGARLSTGERQRVALARALVRSSAGIVVLDEPTAHLDATTEARLVEALGTWLAGRSLVVASHRPRLLELADRAVKVEGGRTCTVPERLTPARLAPASNGTCAARRAE